MVTSVPLNICIITKEWSFISMTECSMVNLPFSMGGSFCSALPYKASNSASAGRPFSVSYQLPACQVGAGTFSPSTSKLPCSRISSAAAPTSTL